MTEIVIGLNKLFNQSGHRLVFWHDAAREFESSLGSIQIAGVALVRLDHIPPLAVKILLERDNPNDRYLLYMPFPEPPLANDWLLDIRLYSGSFRADRTSLFLVELGLGENQALRGHLHIRSKFLFSRDRVARLKKLVQPADTEELIDAKMLAVLVRADQPEVFAITQALFHQLAEDGIDGIPLAWNEIVKFDLEPTFWALIRSAFGYEDGKPSLKKLLIRLLVTEFIAHQPSNEIWPALKPQMLPQKLVSNVLVFLSQWRDSATRGRSYDRLSAQIAKALDVKALLFTRSADGLVDVETFLDVERHIATAVRDVLVASAAGINTAPVRELIVRRKSSHWVSDNLTSTSEVPRAAYSGVYDALMATCDLRDLWIDHSDVLALTDAAGLYLSYQNTLYKFDYAYRRFWEAVYKTRDQGWDILKPLCDWAEDQYSNGFLLRLSLDWGKVLDGGLLQNWRIPNVTNQFDFFDHFVQPTLARGDNQKMVVIVSDGFRYEAAKELVDQLNTRYRFEASVSSQLGVLPSYTALGMAALLPHSQLSYSEQGSVLVDDTSSSGMDNRKQILAAVGGTAVSATSLMAAKREVGRALLSANRVVYVYHNTIDVAGDTAATESSTFVATRNAINQLADLVNQIINSLNGTNVLITADHGYIYEESAPDSTDRTTKIDPSSGIVIDKKRYVIGPKLPNTANVYHGSTEVTASASGGMEFWLPKATNRFHFVGGARYIHGGAMLQEVVIPVVQVRGLKAAAADATKSRPVSIQVLGTSFKVTTNRHRFQFIQTESIGLRIRPVTAQIGVYDDDTPVSTVENVTFDSTSDSIAARTKAVNLVLKSQPYDKKRPYYLIARNAEDSLELQRVEVTIDTAFQNEF